MPKARAARVAAQAKINLFLYVLEGPDPLGYHDVFTLFQRIELADDVVVQVGTSGRAVRLSGSRVPASGLGPDEENLAYRAAVAYAAHSAGAFPQDFSIEITKNIPVGGGLGGGSADAAAVLRALDALAPSRMDPVELLALARSLGADVSYLTSEFVLALGTGRGDVVKEFPSAGGMPQAHVVLVVPPFAVATRDAYGWLDASRSGKQPVRQHIGPVALELSESPWEGLCTRNDFEPVIEARHPALRVYRERLRARGAVAARLAGSGSTVFGIFSGPPPSAADLELDAEIVVTRTASRVVPVDVLE